MCWPGSTSRRRGCGRSRGRARRRSRLNESLDDAGVVDGSLLTLVSVSRTERYRPLVEDVIDAIAVLDESPEFDRDGAESLCRTGDSGRRAGRSP